MLLTEDEINTIASKGQWYFDVNYNSIILGNESFVVTGDGVDDIDRVIQLFAIHPHLAVSVTVGHTATQSRRCTLDDVQAVRARYVELYGAVDRIPASVRPPFAAST